MEIVEAYDLVGSYRGAAELVGCHHDTVRRYVARREEGGDPARPADRPRLIDEFRGKVEEWVDRSNGKIRADVVHGKLVVMGYEGSARTTRRAVADAKEAFGAGRRRVYRPWIPEPGAWVQFDWGEGPSVAGRATLLFCAWLAWCRFRVIIPTWNRTLGTTLSCLDATFRRVGGIPTYALTDNEKTVTSEHIAGVPVRHPDMAAAGRHYSVKIATCVPADPESKGGSEATVKIAKADLVPTEANLRDDFASFSELRGAAAMFCEKVNTRPHRTTRRPPADMLAEEQLRLHPVPADPYVAALGQTRKVTRSSVITVGGTRYSVPHQLIDETVYVRVEGDEIVIAHQGRDGVAEVARHRQATPGNPQLDLSHYPPRSASKILDHTPAPRTPEEAAFLALGPGAAAWLVKAAAAGTAKARTKMDQAVQLAAIHGQGEVDAALAAAAQAHRFGEGDLLSILRHRRRNGDGDDQTVVALSEAHSLQTGTGRWQEVGR